MSSTDLKTRAKRRTVWIIAAVLLPVIIVVVARKIIIEQPFKELRSGQRSLFFAFTDSALEEFTTRIDSFRGIKPFKLDIEYCSGVAAALQKIEGLDSIEELVLAKCDVSDVGLKSVATLPNLKRLTLYQVSFSDTGLDYLAKCPKLERLEAMPRDGARLSLAKVATLPQLKTLDFYDTEPEQWIEPNYEQLKLATQLEFVWLRRELGQEKIAELRQALPNTKIRSGQ